MNNRLAQWLVRKSKKPFRWAFIVGGKCVDPILGGADYVFAEHQEQINVHFARFMDRGRVGILPKLLPPDFPVRSDRTDNKDFDVIVVGRLTPNKNQRALIPLFPYYRIAIIGDGPLYAELKNEAERFPENVYMPGQIPRQEVLSLMGRSRLLVHPSKSNNRLEGLPRVVAEAFASGVPAVVVRDTIPAGFEHGVHGLMVQEHTLRDEIGALLQDAGRLRYLSNNAAAFAGERFTEAAVQKAVDTMSNATLGDREIKRLTTLLRSKYWGMIGLCWVTNHQIRPKLKFFIKHVLATLGLITRENGSTTLR